MLIHAVYEVDLGGEYAASVRTFVIPTSMAKEVYHSLHVQTGHYINLLAFVVPCLACFAAVSIRGHGIEHDLPV
jgi:hypothetical protein